MLSVFSNLTNKITLFQFLFQLLSYHSVNLFMLLISVKKERKYLQVFIFLKNNTYAYRLKEEISLLKESMVGRKESYVIRGSDTMLGKFWVRSS